MGPWVLGLGFWHRVGWVQALGFTVLELGLGFRIGSRLKA